MSKETEKFTMLHYLYNSVYQKEKVHNYKGAIVDLDKIISINPNDFNAYILRGKLYLKTDKYDWSVRDLNKAIELNDKLGWAYYYRGRAKSRLHMPKEAIDDYSKAIDLDPSNAEAYQSRGQCKIDTTLYPYKEAISDFDKAIKLGIDNIEIYINRGYAGFLLGVEQKSIDILKDAKDQIYIAFIKDYKEENSSFLNKFNKDIEAEIAKIEKEQQK